MDTMLKVLLPISILVNLFFLYRAAHYYINGGHETDNAGLSDILYAFLTGVRFDTMVILYGLLPLMLFSLFGLFVSLNTKKFYRSFFRIYSVYLAFLFSFFLYFNIACIDIECLKRLLYFNFFSNYFESFNTSRKEGIYIPSNF